MVKLLKKLLILFLILLIGLWGLILWEANRLVSSYANQRIEIKGALIQKYQNEVERVELKTVDGLKISTWHFRTTNPKGILILLHDLQMNASSILDQGAFFKLSGYETFCLDLRAHGFSKGKQIGFGYEETKDVQALIDWIKKRPEYHGKKIILYGLGMGGAVAINTAAELDEVSLVISVGSYASVERQMLEQCDNQKYINKIKVGFVKKIINHLYQPSVQLILALRYRINPQKASPVNNILKLSTRPVLLVHAEHDVKTLPEHAQKIKNNAGEGTELWIAKEKSSLVELNISLPENKLYQSKILDFIEKNIVTNE